MSDMTIRGEHLYCSKQCEVETPPEFDCFDDGCPFECCGCGDCSNETACPNTGKGYAWHA
jgi:hypothetical protein